MKTPCKKHFNFCLMLFVLLLCSSKITVGQIGYEDIAIVTLYNDSQYVEVYQDSFNIILIDSMGLSTKDCTGACYTVEMNIGSIMYEKHLSAHWAAQAAKDYFQSLDSSIGFDVEVRVNSPDVDPCLPSAWEWDGMNDKGIIHLQRDTTCTLPSSLVISGEWTDVASLDVIGREYAHLVDVQNKNLIGNCPNESDICAILESISDIFGALVELDNGSLDWVFFDNITSAEDLQRSFSSPHGGGKYWTYNGAVARFDGQADFLMQSGYWPDNLISNSFAPLVKTGVLNHWFYLLVLGGENEVITGAGNDTIVVDGSTISPDSIGMLVYDLLVSNGVNGLTNSSTFTVFANNFINSAYANGIDSSSTAMCNIYRAFNAVNIWPDDSRECPQPLGDTISIEYLDPDKETALLTANVVGGSGCFNYSWQVGNGWMIVEGDNDPSILISGPSGTIPSYGVIVEDDYLDCNPLVLNVKENIPTQLEFELLGNPLVNDLRLYQKSNTLNGLTLSLNDINGVCLKHFIERESTGGVLHYDVSDLPSGLYFLKIEVEGIGFTTKVFVKM